MEADDAGSQKQVALDAHLDEFLERLTPSLGRPDRRRQARTYVAGLLLEGERKSVQPLAGRLGATDNGQALHHFVAHSPWACEGLFVAMTQEAARLWPRPHAWIIDETSFPKAGSHSVGVAAQYGGASGKIANCQVAVSLHYAAGGTGQGTGSAALGWRLFLPREWIGDATRRQKAGVPASIPYRSKNALALELIDEALARGLPPAPVLADSDYGDDYSWRAALRSRQVGYCVAVEPEAKAWTSAPVGSPPPAAGRPAPQDPLPAPKRLDQIACELPLQAWRKLTWRAGTRGPMQGRFARVPIRASHGYTQRQHQGARAREWLFVEWPPDKDTPTDYWLAHLGAGTKTPTLKTLVGLARERWRVEQDYRELKDELGLDHFEGRSWLGWHHHVALTCLAHLFLQGERRLPTRATQKKPGASVRVRKPAADTPPPARRSRAEIMRPLSLVPHALRLFLEK